jgi:meiotically up-regulated gene 157 (Mug157) protein
MPQVHLKPMHKNCWNIIKKLKYSKGITFLFDVDSVCKNVKTNHLSWILTDATFVDTHKNGMKILLRMWKQKEMQHHLQIVKGTELVV